MTTAEQRAREVAARRAPRQPRDAEAERRRIEERTLEVWVDEGDAGVRDEAAGAVVRAAGRPAPVRRPGRPVDPDVAAAIVAHVGDRRRADRLVQRLAQAQAALDADRLGEARRLAVGLTREVPGVATAHEVAGLVAYRSGRWRDAVRELEVAQDLAGNVELLPVLADSYRALHRWNDVERIWTTVREVSPSHQVLAEARIVAAGAQADRGDIAGALRTMARVPSKPKRVRDHHVRQWYVIGDLHDRAGDTLDAIRWFQRVAAEDADFVDVQARLRALGR